MSKDLVRRWRRVAREWEAVAARHNAIEGDVPAGGHKFPEGAVRASAYARILNECADSLERSIAIATRKAVTRGRA